MAKKGKGFFGSIGSFLGSIPAVGKVKNAAKSVKKKIKNTKKKLKKALKKAKKKLKKKLKKKIGKVFTKARKLKNNLSKSKMVKKFKRAAKKVVLAAKQAAKKTSTKVKQAVKEVKATVKETVVPLKPSKGKVEKISKKVGNKIQGEAELAKFFDEYLKDRKTVGPIGNKYSVQDGNPLTTLQDKQRVLGGGNHSRTKKSTAVDQFIYSLLIEDYVTLVDPKATLGEKALAGLSMVPIFKPVKAVDAAYDTAKIYNKTRVIENVNDSKKIRASSNFNNYKNKEKEVLENIKNSAKKVEVTEQDSKQLAEYAKSLDKGTGNLSETIKQGQKTPKHSEVKNKNNLPGKGEPNSSADLLNPDGTVKQRRYYDEQGRAKEDIDFNHSDDGTHTFPHRHKWDWSKKPPRQKPE